MATMYAWAPITIAGGTTIPVGDKVSKDQVGDDWAGLIAAGVIRKKKYPEGVRTGESPRNAELRKVNEQMKKLQEPFAEDYTEDDDEPGSELTESDANPEGKKFWELGKS